MTTELLKAPPQTVITHPRAQKIDVAKALKLRLQGNTFDEIGLIFDCNGSAVHQALAKFAPFLNGIGPGELTAYSESRSELFNRVEQTLTASLLDAGKIEKASLNNVAYAFKQIHEARRLESGQSTNNISVLGKFLMQAEDGLGKTTPHPVAAQQARGKMSKRATSKRSAQAEAQAGPDLRSESTNNCP